MLFQTIIADRWRWGIVRLPSKTGVAQRLGTPPLKKIDLTFVARFGFLSSECFLNRQALSG